MKPDGTTALGPGLLSSLCIASKGKPGSKVIICTDGLANIGLGNVERVSDLTETKKFYLKVAEQAKELGIVISVISLVSAECRLDLLSPIADMTNGGILRVNPLTLHKDFESLMEEKVILTNVTVRGRLPAPLQFMDTPEEYLRNNASVFVQEIGNATLNTKISVRFVLRPIDQLEKLPNFDPTDIYALPLQAEIEYKDLKGNRYLRVITRKVECTEDEEEALESVEETVVWGCCGGSAARYAKSGQYYESKQAIGKALKMLKSKEAQEKLEEKMAPLHQAIAEQEGFSGKDQKLDNLTSQVNQFMK